MRAVDLIRQKRDGGVLDPGAIQAFVDGATDGSWPDYQVAALLMAIVVRGMSLDEAIALTDAMVRSGQRLDLSEFGGVPVDKHSTGGVGDQTSLILAPLAAACGVVVPMMSGRGLGHTGGTLDKLEAIPGFRTNLTLAEMRRVLRQTGCVLIGQTDEIAPADRKLYALRDVTATVESRPLICASILSKKIAEGIGGLVLDVKVGRGAFMKTREEARALASWLIRIAEGNGVRTEALLTSMDAPLGRAVGNASEVVEAIETLKGRGPKDLEDLSVALAARLLVLAGVAADDGDAERQVRAVLASGAGLEKFRDVILAQGGDPRVVDDPDRLLGGGTRAQVVEADRDGIVQRVDAWGIGRAAFVLGAGRRRAEDPVDFGVGLEVHVEPGATVAKGQPLVTVHHRDGRALDEALAMIDEALVIADERPTVSPLLLETITST